MGGSDNPFSRWQIGDVRVTRIVESTADWIGPHLLPQATPEHLKAIDWLAPFIDTGGNILLSIHALVVETPSRRIVVDTCVGNGKERTVPDWNDAEHRFLEDFAAAGFETMGIDTVLCTHLHLDHVGWNTRRVEDRWVPTFARADYLFAEREWDHWRSEPQEAGPVIEDSVQPIFDAGLARLVAENHAVSDEVCLLPTPGHTPGHVSVHIRSRGEEAVITGDMVHHPCQIVHDEWSSTFDTDPERSARTRREFFRRFADTPTLIIGTHFAGPTAGRLVRDGSSYRLDY